MTDKQVREKLKSVIYKSDLFDRGDTESNVDKLADAILTTFPTLGMERLEESKVERHIHQGFLGLTNQDEKNIAKSILSKFCADKVVYPEEVKVPDYNSEHGSWGNYGDSYDHGWRIGKAIGRNEAIKEMKEMNNGLISNFRFFNRALSPKEIKKLYKKELNNER